MSTSLPPPQSSHSPASASSSPPFVPPAQPQSSADVLPFPQPQPQIEPQLEPQPQPQLEPQPEPPVIPTHPQGAAGAPARRPFNLPDHFPFRLPATRSGRVALALCVVYLVWGSTYMAVHLSLESFRH